MREMGAVQRQPETIVAVLLTETEFKFTVELLQAARIPFGAHALAAAVDEKFRGAVPVNLPQQPAEEPGAEAPAPPEEQPEG